MLRLHDNQWDGIREHFPEEHIPDSCPGCKPVPTRVVLDAVLWILNTSSRWHLVPQWYPHYTTIHRRFQTWCQQEVLREVLVQLANALRDEGTIDEHKHFIDTTFAAAKGTVCTSTITWPMPLLQAIGTGLNHYHYRDCATGMCRQDRAA